MSTLAELVVKIDADIGNLQQKMTPARRAVNQLGEAASAAGRAMTIGLTLPLAAVGVASVGAASEMDSLTRGLTAVSGSAAETQRQLARLQEAAKLPGLGFREAIRGSIALQAAGLSAALAERSLTAFGNALATVGKGKADLDGVTLALSQIASKGKISAEEINQLSERVPQVRQAMIAAFGSADTEKLGKAGITATVFITRLAAELEKLPRVTGGAANSFENLSDAWFRARVAIGNQLLPAVIPLVEGLASMLVQVRQLDPGTVRWGLAIAGVAAVAGPLVIVVGSLATAVTSLSTALSIGLLPLIITGGPILIGLAAISALFVKNRLDALAAAAAADQFRASLGALSALELTKKHGDVEDELSVLRSRQAALAARASRTTGEGQSATIQAQSQRIAEQIAEATARRREIEKAQTALLLTPPTITPPAFNLNIPATASELKKAADAARDLNDALFESRFGGFGELFDQAEKLRGEIHGITEDIAAAGGQAPRGALALLDQKKVELERVLALLNRAATGVGVAAANVSGSDLFAHQVRNRITGGGADIKQIESGDLLHSMRIAKEGAKGEAESFAQAANTAQIGLADLASALGSIGQPMRNALTGLNSFAQGIAQLQASWGKRGLAGIAGTIGGIGAAVGGVISAVQGLGAILSGTTREISANVDALRQLRLGATGFEVSRSSIDAAIAAVQGLLSADFLSRVVDSSGILAAQGLNKDQLVAIAQEIGFTLTNEQGGLNLTASNLKEFLEALRLSTQGTNKFGDALNKAAAAMINAAPGFRLAGAVWAVQDPRVPQWTPPPAPTVPATTDPGSTTAPLADVTIPISIDLSGVRSRWTPSDRQGALAAAWELLRLGSQDEGGSGPVSTIFHRLPRPAAMGA